MTNNWSDISHLLHEGELSSIDWDPYLEEVILVVHGLRRGPEGENLCSIPIYLKLNGVTGLFIGHDPEELSLHPDNYHLHRRLQKEDLEDWPFAPQEFHLSLQSPQSVEDALASFKGEWACGEAAVLQSGMTLTIGFDYSFLLGDEAQNIRLVFVCESFEVESQGVSLTPETWLAQYRAWWDGWRTHWNKVDAGEVDEDEDASLECTFIPAAIDPETPERIIHAPKEPVFQLLNHDLSKEMIQPLRLWFESIHTRLSSDYTRATEVLGQDFTEQVKDTEESYHWKSSKRPYARQIDSSWIFRNSACVVVRGVEHRPADDEEESSNVESVWTFRLRRRGSRWVLRSWTQGWPPYGSAPKKMASEKPWLSDWNSGPILSG